VFMDNQPMGHTGDRLTIQAGFHDFDLGSPANYTPAMQNVNVVNTTAPNPTIVPFAPLRRAKRKAKAAKRVTKKVSRKKVSRKKASRKKTAKKAKKIAPKRKTANTTAAVKKSRKKKQRTRRKAPSR
jgi:hypothetical protein